MRNFTDAERHAANQRLLNEAVAHLRKTGVKSVDDQGRCLYGGSGCAFSVAIPPEHREAADTPVSQGGTVAASAASSLIESGSLIFGWAFAVDPDFADDLQNCHDCAPEGVNFFPCFKAGAVTLAVKWRLTYSEQETQV